MRLGVAPSDSNELEGTGSDAGDGGKSKGSLLKNSGGEGGSRTGRAAALAYDKDEDTGRREAMIKELKEKAKAAALEVITNGTAEWVTKTWLERMKMWHHKCQHLAPKSAQKRLDLAPPHQPWPPPPV